MSNFPHRFYGHSKAVLKGIQSRAHILNVDEFVSTNFHFYVVFISELEFYIYPKGAKFV